MVGSVVVLEVRRWRRYGKDRLYVRASDGPDLGWWDLTDDTGHPAGPENEASLLEGVTMWRARTVEHAATSPLHGTAAAPAVSERATPPIPMSTTGPDFVPPQTPSWQAAVAGPSVENASMARFAPPHGSPVTDLLAHRPGEQLADKVAASREAGERPTFLRRILLGKNAYSTWERGLIGERLVAAELAKMVGTDHRWGFLHSIPVGANSDIDLFVIGPPGVFTINAKYHRGANIWVGGDTLMVNGARQPYVRNSRHEARKAARLLTVATGTPVGVRGVIVPVDAHSFTVREQPGDVHVVNRTRLTAYLRSLPEVLPAPVIDQIFSAARLSSTWMPNL